MNVINAVKIAATAIVAVMLLTGCASNRKAENTIDGTTASKTEAEKREPLGTLIKKDTLYWYCGDGESDVVCTLYPGGTFRVSGKGEMRDYPGIFADNTTYPGEWWGEVNNRSIKHVIIEEGVTSIGDYAFIDCYYLRSVTIPNSVTSINLSAFQNCKKKLTSITIPNSVTYIGEEAFYGCSSLTSVTLSNTITSIEGGTFASCANLTSVTIPGSVTSIGAGAFERCFNLTSVTIQEGVRSIGDAAFLRCSSLTSITIPSSVDSIGEHTFYRCEKLISVISLNPEPPVIVPSYSSSQYKGYWDECGKSGKYISGRLVDNEIYCDTRRPIDACLYVPEDSIDKYRAFRRRWGFDCIKAIGEAPTVIENAD